MAFPEPVPTLSKEEFEQFQEELEEFELDDEIEARIQKHREALREENNCLSS